jgi:hypothetical protein
MSDTPPLFSPPIVILNVVKDIGAAIGLEKSLSPAVL